NVERRDKESAHSHLDSFSVVDTLCAMGTQPVHLLHCPLLSRKPTATKLARGLFCGQLLARMLDPLAKPPIARHLPAHLVYTMDHGRMISSSERLPDLDQLHLQQLAG